MCPQTIIVSDYGLPPLRHQAIIWTNAGLLWIWPIGTHFSEIWIKLHEFSLKEIHLKMWSAKCQPSYLLSRPWYIETLRMRQNGHHFADDIIKCIFFIKNIWITIKISMKFIAKGPVGNNSTLVQIMAWHYLCQAIIWSNDGTVCWYINTALGLYELPITLQVWVPYLYKTRTWSSLRLLIDVSSGHFVDCIKSDMIFFSVSLVTYDFVCAFADQITRYWYYNM